MSTSSRLDLNTDENRSNETRNEKHFEDGNFPVIRPKYDQRTQAHHMVTGHNASRKQKYRVSHRSNSNPNRPLATVSHAITKQGNSYIT